MDSRKGMRLRVQKAFFFFFFSFLFWAHFPLCLAAWRGNNRDGTLIEKHRSSVKRSRRRENVHSDLHLGLIGPSHLPSPLFFLYSIRFPSNRLFSSFLISTYLNLASSFIIAAFFFTKGGGGGYSWHLLQPLTPLQPKLGPYRYIFFSIEFFNL